MATSPFSMVVGPGELYVAPTGESFPSVDETPEGNWSKLGADGSRSFTEDGLTISNEQSLSERYVVGSTGARKAVRTQETMSVSGTLVDLTIENIAKILNDASVTETDEGASQIGTHEVDVYRGGDVNQFAVLIRYDSPYGDTWQTQVEIPVMYSSGNLEYTLNKETSEVSFEFTALEDPDAATSSERFGRIIAQDADETD